MERNIFMSLQKASLLWHDDSTDYASCSPKDRTKCVLILTPESEWLYDNHILAKYHSTSVTWLLIYPVVSANKGFCEPTGLEIGAEECDEGTLQVCRCGDLTRPPAKSNLFAVLPSAFLKHRLSSKPPTKADLCNLCRPSGTLTNGYEGVF